jgi:RNA polymerase sigma factor (TIGR02999 family)
MSDITPLLSAIQQGDPQAASRLLPLVYDELRKLAAAKLRHEKPGQTLDATALVHEAYLRLAGDQTFDSRRHFYAAAAEAMRRILIDRARARQAYKRCGDGQRLDVELDQLQARHADSELVDIDSLLDDLAKTDAEAAELVRQHVFGGLSLEEAGALLGMSRATAYRNWAFARAWLRDALGAAEKNRRPMRQVM